MSLTAIHTRSARLAAGAVHRTGFAFSLTQCPQKRRLSSDMLEADPQKHLMGSSANYISSPFIQRSLGWNEHASHLEFQAKQVDNADAKMAMKYFTMDSYSFQPEEEDNTHTTSEEASDTVDGPLGTTQGGGFVSSKGVATGTTVPGDDTGNT